MAIRDALRKNRRRMVSNRARRLSAESLETRRLLSADCSVLPVSPVDSSFTGSYPLSQSDLGASSLEVAEGEEATFSPIRLDFGTASSPVAAGYTRVGKNDVYAGSGHGWLSSTLLDDRNRASGNDLQRDFVFTFDSSMSFAVDVPDGTYDVTVIMGDASYTHEQMQLSVEGAVQAVVTQGPGVFQTNTFTVGVTDSQMTFDWLDLAGPDPVVLVNSIEILANAPPETLTLTIDSASISESGGTSTATVTRNGSTTGDLEVALSSDDTSEATVPATVTILDGDPSVEFTVTAVDDPIVDGTQTVTITATASGFQDGADSLDVTDDEVTFTPIRLDFGTASSPVAAGYTRVGKNDVYSGSGYGWLSSTLLDDRNRASGNDLQRDFVFTFDSSMSFAVDVPDGTYDVTVIMGDGSYAHEQMQLSVEGDVQAVVTQGPGVFPTNTFTVGVTDSQMTFDWLDLAGPDPVVLVNSIEILQNAVPETLTLKLDSASISESGGASTATVTRSGSTTGDLEVALSSDDTSEATVPATVTILDGDPSVEFTVTAVDDPINDGTQTVTISATASGFQDGADSLNVTDDEVTFTPIRLDFGTASSPVAAGYTRVGKNDVYSGSGYGWLSSTLLDGRNRASGNDLQRDFVFTFDSAMSFAVDVPDGTYDVTVIMGDGSYTHEQMQLSVEGDVQAVVTQSGPGDFHTNTFTVGVTDSQMTFDWLDLAGPDPVVLVNSIEILQNAVPGALTLSIDSAFFSESGGASTATVTRSGSTTGDLVVSLSSDDTGEATVPATVTISDGDPSAQFTVTGVDDVILDGRQRVTITASAAGFSTTDQLIRVTDSEGIQYDVIYADAANEGFFDQTLGQQRRDAFEFAVDIISSLIHNAYPNETIEISAKFDQLGGSPSSATLGSAGPVSIWRDFSGGLSNTWYADALANHLHGSDLGAGPEIVATFNSDVDNSTVLGNTDWYYGFDGNTGGDIDLVTVVLHEIGHGLNFLDLIDSDGAWSFGNLPGIFDRFLEDSGGTPLISQTQSQRAADIVSNALYWSGSAGAAGNSGQRPRMYAPTTFQPGSSVSHLDEGVHGNQLMSPSYSGVDHVFSAMEKGMLADMGWDVPFAGGGSAASSIFNDSTAFGGSRVHSQGSTFLGPGADMRRTSLAIRGMTSEWPGSSLETRIASGAYANDFSAEQRSKVDFSDDFTGIRSTGMHLSEDQLDHFKAGHRRDAGFDTAADEGTSLGMDGAKSTVLNNSDWAWYFGNHNE